MSVANKRISSTFLDFYYQSLSTAPQKIADAYIPNAHISFNLLNKSFPSSLSKSNIAGVMSEKFSSLSRVDVDTISESLNGDVFEIKVVGAFSFHDETPKCQFIHNLTLQQLKEGTFGVQKDEIVPGKASAMDWAADSPPMFAAEGDVSDLPHLGMPSSEAAENSAKLEAEKKAKAEAEAQAAAAKKAAEAAAAVAAAEAAAVAAEKAANVAAAEKAATEAAEAKAKAEAEAVAQEAAKAEAEAKAAAAAKKAAEEEERRKREEEAKNIDLSKLSVADRLRVKQGMSLTAAKPVVAAKESPAPVEKPAAAAAASEKPAGHKRGLTSTITSMTTGTAIPTNDKNESNLPVHYDIFIRALPSTVFQEQIFEIIKIEPALVERMKTAVKADKGGIERTFVFVRLNRESIAARSLEVDAVVAEVIAKSEGSVLNGKKIVVEKSRDKEVYTTARPVREPRKDERKAPAETEVAKKTPVVPVGTSIKIKTPATNPWGKAPAAPPAQ